MKLCVLSDDGDAVSVEIAGKVTQAKASPFDDPLGELLGSDGYGRDVLLDMSQVEVLDSSGIGWLLTCQKRFREAGGALVLHSLSPMSRNVIKVLNMHAVFKMASSGEEALRMLEGKTP
jgi:anti-anti-sigma factor